MAAASWLNGLRIDLVNRGAISAALGGGGVQYLQGAPAISAPLARVLDRLKENLVKDKGLSTRKKPRIGRRGSPGALTTIRTVRRTSASRSARGLGDRRKRS